jgi:signal transduction histidine kinase
VPSGDGGEVPAAGPRDPSPAYRGKHRAPAAEDPAGSAAADGAVVVEEAVAAERARIARDLHDSVDKTLHGIALAATSLAASLTGQDGPADAESLGPRLRELASFARYAISETRCVIYDLRDDAFSAPLGDMVRSVATAWSSGAVVPVSLAVPPDADAAGESRREIIAILREALRNVEMHAHATRVRVSMRKAAERLLLTISDNGAGFSLPADPERLQATAHYGLIGMTERARKLGGTLVIRSRPGHGTRIAVQVPADAAETAR